MSSRERPDIDDPDSPTMRTDQDTSDEARATYEGMPERGRVPEAGAHDQAGSRQARVAGSATFEERPPVGMESSAIHVAYHVLEDC